MRFFLKEIIPRVHVLGEPKLLFANRLPLLGEPGNELATLQPRNKKISSLKCKIPNTTDVFKQCVHLSNEAICSIM